jgi:hypothetical protein
MIRGRPLSHWRPIRFFDALDPFIRRYGETFETKMSVLPNCAGQTL